LDTNALRLFLVGEINTVRRVRENSKATFLSSVAVEELLTGHLSSINHARRPRTTLSLPRAHQDLAQALEDIGSFPVFAYSEQAEALYRNFPASVLRVGAQDCRIAAQALAHDLVVVTRNLRDFEVIGAPCADWSAAAA